MLVAAIILAAGEGRRMGGPKALARLRGETLLAHVLRAFADVAVRIVVTGAEHDHVEAEAARFSNVRIARNVAWRGGMLGSILTGLEAAEALLAEAVLVHPVDHPLVRPEAVRDVSSALTRGAPIAVPSYQKRRGHPAGFSAAVWPDLREADPSIGARAVLTLRSEVVQHVPAGPECLWGINCPADLAALEAPEGDLI